MVIKIMELKDVILSTLAEMEEIPFDTKKNKHEVKEKILIEEEVELNVSDSELMYLSSIKERLLVLFEGFQSPNNTNIEAKVDITLNFLEYILATIDTRVEFLEKRKK